MDSGRAASGAAAAFSFSDFGVLYRTDAQSEPLVAALARSGRPFQKRSHLALADGPLVQSFVRAMRELPAEWPWTRSGGCCSSA